MRATKANEELVKVIINIFAEKNCTVNDVEEVLMYVGHAIKNSTTVQKVNKKLFELED